MSDDAFRVSALLFAAFALVGFAGFAAALNIADCATLNAANTFYNLTADIVNTSFDICMNVTASNVTLECNGKLIDSDRTLGAGLYGVFANDTSGFTVLDCSLSDWTKAGVLASNGSNYTRVSNCTFQNLEGVSNTIGLQFGNPSDANYFHSSTVSYNTFTNFDPSLRIYANAVNLTISNNSFRNLVSTPGSLQIGDATGKAPVANSINNSFFYNNTFLGGGVELVGYNVNNTVDCAGAVLNGTTVSDYSSFGGFHLYGINNTVKNCFIYNSPGIEIDFYDLDSGEEFNSNSTVFNNTIQYVHCRVPPAFSGSSPSLSCPGFGILVGSSNNVTWNRIQHVPTSAGFGIRFGSNNNVSFNTIGNFSDGDGLIAYGGNDNVSYNTVQNVTTAGTKCLLVDPLVGGTGFSKFQRNSLKDCDTAILESANYPTGNEYYGNTMNNSFCAIYLTGGSMNSSFHDNVITYSSNSTFSLLTNDYNITSTNDVMQNTAPGGVDFAFGDPLAGFPTGSSSITLLNTSFNKSAVVFNTLDADSNLTVKWFVEVHVVDNTSADVSGANVNISNTRNTSFQYETFNLTTNGTGWISWQNVTEYFQNNISTLNFTPHNISASKTGFPTNVTTGNSVSHDPVFTIMLGGGAGPTSEAPYAVAILSPLNETWVNQRYLNVTGICNSSTIPLVNVSINFNGSSVGNSSNVLNATAFYFNVSVPSDGYYYYNLTCNSTDSLSNTSETRLLKVDTTPPGVTINQPANGSSYFSTAWLTINVTASDSGIGLDKAVSNSSLWSGVLSPTGNYFNFTNTSSLAAGSYCVNVTVNDSLGNWNYSYVCFTLFQSYAPYAVAILSPSNDTWVNQKYLNVTGICNSSTIPLVNVSINFNGSSVGNSSDVLNATAFYFNVSVAGDGYYYYNLTCNSTDTLSNTSETRLRKIDSTPPVVVLNAPPNFRATNETLTQFSFNATDVFSASMDCSLFLNGTLSQTNSSTPNNTNTAFSVALLPEGNTTWRVDCADALANSGSSSNRNILIDRTPPSFFNIASSDVLKNLATVSWDASELADCWIEYGVTADFGTNSSIDAFAINHVRTLSTLASCMPYYYKIWGFDEVGNLGSSVVNTFTTQGCGGGGGSGGGGGGGGLPSPTPSATVEPTISPTAEPTVIPPGPTSTPTVLPTEVPSQSGMGVTSSCVSGTPRELVLTRVLTVFETGQAFYTLVNLTVANKGSLVIADVRVTDEIPQALVARVRFLNAPSALAGGNATWIAGALAPGESKSFAYVLPGRVGPNSFTLPTTSGKINLVSLDWNLLFELLLLLALLLVAFASYLRARRKRTH